MKIVPEIKFITNPKPRKACKYCVRGAPSKIMKGSIYCSEKNQWMKPTDKCNAYIFDTSQFDEQYKPTGLKD
jgi:hypothetical protein